MSAWVLSLGSYESWPLARLAALVALCAVLVLVALPLLVTGVLVIRLLAATERAALRVPAAATASSAPHRRGGMA